MGKKYWSQVGPVLDILVAKYPKAFFPKDSPETKPLQIGVFTLITGQNPDIPRPIIGEFLRRYTSKTRYLRALAACSDRVDLAGEPFEPVSQRARDRATLELLARQEKQLKRAA
mgnify:CR=1 FL=1